MINIIQILYKIEITYRKREYTNYVHCIIKHIYVAIIHFLFSNQWRSTKLR